MSYKCTNAIASKKHDNDNDNDDKVAHYGKTGSYHP